ncbi:MAG: hypothetical protein KIG88_10570 [Weeksellaceae bacterium]|nr:hypothetical protein [Weeksellaceae bacterium]
MKKNLLTLSLIASVFTYAQDTYIGSNAVVKVQPNTLFYNGGNVTLNAVTNTAEIVKNQGNIVINNTFESTSSPVILNGEDINKNVGQHFVNLYTDNKNYGQVIINGNATGKLTMQKKSVNKTSITQLPISIPFAGNVTEIMNSFPNNTRGFRGNCPIDTQCGQRYWMTLYKWNNNSIVNDAVVDADLFQPGAYYLLNLIDNAGINGDFDGEKLINYKGTAAPENVSFTGLKTVIHNYRVNDGNNPNNNTDEHNVFQGLTYNQWKSKKNKYQETYQSYLGNGTDDLQFGKNMFRFGNPYTSNLDLSNVASWMNLPGETFELIKLAQSYTHSWNNTTGSSENSTGGDQYVTATYTNGAWSGDAEAVLIRPLEMFRIKFHKDNLVTLNVDFKDTHKTFQQTLTVPGTTNTSPRVQSSEFNQLEVLLVDNDNNLISEPVYLANSSNFETGANINKTSGNKMLLIEEDIDGNIIANAKSLVNTFNNSDYVGKPLNLELNNLPAGNSYKLRFNLKENSIFTENIEQLSNNNKFYIHDKVNDTFTEISANTVVDINVNNETANQYAFYWNATPRTLGTGDVTKTFKTQVYKYAEDVYKVKFDSSKTLANVEVYNVNGTKASSQNNIQVNNNDYTLKLPVGVSGLFIVKVVYNDGTTNNIKVLVD